MTTHKSIFYQAQEQVCEALNNDDVLSGKVTFISENSKDIDYEIKNAIGRQGIVGVVMTPEATYQGITDKGEQVWDLRDFTVQVVENPIINRGQPNYANITAHDAVTRAAEVLADPRFGLFGQYCPTTIEQGEDEGLIVAQCKFNVQVKGEAGVFSNAPKKQGLYFTNGDVVNVSDETGANIFSAYAIHSVVYVLGHPTTDVGPTDIEDVAIYGLSPVQTSIRWLSRSPLKRIWIGKDVLLNKPSPGEPGLNYFADVRDTLEGIYFIGRTKAEVQSMVGYPWGLPNGHVLHCTDGDITI